MPAEPDISVIVVTHNGCEMALSTLRSARDSLGAVNAQWLVVDSGSTDGTPDAIEDEWPDVSVIRKPNVGFAAANNVGLELTRGRYVLLLNPDVEVLSGTLEGLVRALDERPTTGAVSVVQRGGDGSLLPTIRRFPSAARQLGEALSVERVRALRRFQEPETRADRYDRETEADWLVGAFLAVRASAVADVGPLDERFFLYSEETDWCYRLKKAGWDIRHIPVMEVTHYGGSYPRPALAAQLSYSKLLFARKHLGRRRSLGFSAALVVRHGLRMAGCAVIAAARPAARKRLAAERRALTVALGLHRPTLGA